MKQQIRRFPGVGDSTADRGLRLEAVLGLLTVLREPFQAAAVANGAGVALRSASRRCHAAVQARRLRLVRRGTAGQPAIFVGASRSRARKEPKT